MIQINKDTKQFHLSNENISYILKIGPNGEPLQLHFGQKIQDKNYDYLLQQQARPGSSYVFEDDMSFSLEHTTSEYPSFGTTDFRMPAYSVLQSNGSKITNLQFQTADKFEGTPELDGLPHAISKNEAETLVLHMYDEEAQLVIDLYYTIFKKIDVIARHVTFKNIGINDMYIDRAMSMNLDLHDHSYDFVHLTGAWGRERHVKTQPLIEGIQSIGSLRGHSSPHHNPFYALKRPNTDEFQGEVIGVALAYSGNFLGQVEVDTYHKTRLTIGIHPETFKWKLSPNKIFTTPQSYIVYSSNGLNRMSQQYHKLSNEYLIRPKWRNYERPIVINNWEGTYFDFDEKKLLNIANVAQEVGIEMFVLDDGWFGERNDDFAGLGDFDVNKNKLPGGLTQLSKELAKKDLDFGLWVEPEMINKISKLYKAQPEWAIHTPKRSMSHGRNQYVLDFANPKIVDYIYNELYKVLKSANIKYVKWDMNRSMTEVYSNSLPYEQQGEVYHRYILGLYSLFERLITAFPHILFESCASGGGRFDLGMLYYAPQTWTSDNTDAYRRQFIQYGTSFVYPQSTMGNHVSKSPNEQEHRESSLYTRGNVAYFGAFGYELDLTQLSEKEKDEIKMQTDFMKKHRQCLQFGTFYRLISPDSGLYTSWMTINSSTQDAIVAVYKHLNIANSPKYRVKLTGLNPDQAYKINNEQEIYYGSELMQIGIPIPDTSAGELRNGESPTYDFDSWIFILHAL